jgi:hypothetical protein
MRIVGRWGEQEGPPAASTGYSAGSKVKVPTEFATLLADVFEITHLLMSNNLDYAEELFTRKRIIHNDLETLEKRLGEKMQDAREHLSRVEHYWKNKIWDEVVDQLSMMIGSLMEEM